MAKYGLTTEKLETQIARVDYLRFGKTGIFCYITLVNGYIVTGESVCIDPTSFNEETGKQKAYAKAFAELSVILSYGEKQRWYKETQLTYVDHLAEELSDLDEKRTKLAELLAKGQSDAISDEEWDRLNKQEEVMGAYALILQERLIYAKRN